MAGRPPKLQPKELLAEYDLLDWFWPLIWDKDEPCVLKFSDGSEATFHRGERVIFPKQLEFLESLFAYRATLFGGAKGPGKIAYRGQDILTPFGFKKIEDFEVGDLISNPDGSVSSVIQLHPWEECQVWRVHFHDGTFTDVAEQHLWLAWRPTRVQKHKGKRLSGQDAAQVCETRQLKEWVDFARSRTGKQAIGLLPCIPVCEEQAFNATSRNPDLIDPYLLGLLLGDGHFAEGSISIASADIEHMDKEMAGYEYSWWAPKINKDGTENKARALAFTGDSSAKIKYALSTLGLRDARSGNKFIPRAFKLGSIDTRYAVVQGLMDTDGTVSEDGDVGYTSVSKQLAEDVAFVIRSLGGVVTITIKKMSEKKETYQDAYTLYIKHPKPEKLFRLSRKVARAKKASPHRTFFKKVVDVEVLSEVREGRCLTVAHPNGLYIVNDFIVTHNSRSMLRFMCFYLMVLAKNGHPGANGAIFCETFKACWDRYGTDIMKGRHFPEWMGEFNQQHMVFRAHEEYGGWTLEFRNTIDFAEVEKSTQYAIIGIDESTNQKEEFFDHIETCMRWSTNGIYVEHCPILLATNPVGLGLAWHKRRFVDALTRDKEEYDPINNHLRLGHNFIQALPTDNPTLSPAYLSGLLNKPAKIRDAYYFGLWDVFEGQFYDLDERVHTVNPAHVVLGLNWTYTLSLDYGYGHTACALVSATDHNGNTYFIDCVSVTGKTAREMKELMKEQFVFKTGPNKGKPYPFSIQVADPDLFKDRGSFEGNKTAIEIWNSPDKDDNGNIVFSGFRFIAANNARKSGWLALREGFHYEFEETTDKYGRTVRSPRTLPAIRIFSTLTELWSSLTLLQHKQNDPDDAEKTLGSYQPGEGDDEAEAARYNIMACRKGEFGAGSEGIDENPRDLLLYGGRLDWDHASSPSEQPSIWAQ